MENTKIEWAQHTFSPWHGCAKVSPGCKNCYADAQHNFHYSSLKSQQGTCWGVNAPRLAVSADTWKKPLKWNREAQAAGVRARVFCASMADVFEGQSAASHLYINETAQVPSGPGKTRTVRFVDMAVERLRLLRLIYDTPHLDWLLLTKRPENIVPALHSAYQASMPGNSESSGLLHFSHWLGQWAEGKQVPANVWLGTSVENQEQADIRVPQLLAAPAAVRFLSCEPLLGPVRLDGSKPCPCGGFKGAIGTDAKGNEVEAPSCDDCGGNGWKGNRWLSGGDIDWVIVGGESGPRARPMHCSWARSLREQCQHTGVAFLFKQWGEWAPVEWGRPGFDVGYEGYLDGEYHSLTCTAGMAKVESIAAERITIWPHGRGDGAIHNYPVDEVYVVKVGKTLAGRQLDGRTWDEVPTPQPVAP